MSWVTPLGSLCLASLGSSHLLFPLLPLLHILLQRYNYLLSPVGLSSESAILGAVLATPPRPPQGPRASCSQPKTASWRV